MNKTVELKDAYPGINRRYAIWMRWVGIPADHEKIADHSSTHMCLARRSEESNDYAGIYSIWLDRRLSEWVRTLKGYETCERSVCNSCIGCALETTHDGVQGHKMADDWLESWCKKHKCPVRFVSYKKEMEEFEHEFAEEEKERQARRIR